MRQEPSDEDERSLDSHDDDDKVTAESTSRRARRRARSNSRMETRTNRRGGARRSVDDFLQETLEELECMEQDDSSRIRALDWLERILARWSFDCHAKSTSATTATSSSKDDHDDDPRSPSKKKARAPAPPIVNSWQRPRPVLITFGSYRLGVHRPSSDLDLLVLAPSHCTRQDFFSSLVSLLNKQDASIIQQVHPIPTAYTPVIKFTLYGLSVDLLFARGNSTKILQFQQKRPNPLLMSTANSNGDHRSDEYPIDDTDLMDQDEPGVRSLNGARVSQMILEAVPDLETYRTVLIAVKQWAIAKGVYSNVLGFLGGINYAIMVAYVCIQNPLIGQSPVALLERFFQTFAAWKWPDPIMIGPLQSERPSSCSVPMACWNPVINRRDRLHLMPIITPAYPAMNSAYNVDSPQLRRMTHEFTLAANWMMQCKSRRTCFYYLFQPCSFWLDHHHFVHVTITSKTHQEHVEWLRLVESRLRKLISSLETPEIQVWPLSKLFHKPRGMQPSLEKGSDIKQAEEGYETSFFIGLRFAPGTDIADLRGLTSDFCHQVNTWEKRTANMDLSLVCIVASQMPHYVLPPLKRLDDAVSTETASSSSWESSDDGLDDLDDDDDGGGAADTLDVDKGQQDPAQDEGFSSKKETTATSESIVDPIVDTPSN